VAIGVCDGVGDVRRTAPCSRAEPSAASTVRERASADDETTTTTTTTTTPTGMSALLMRARSMSALASESYRVRLSSAASVTRDGVPKSTTAPS
jgi:hypothetical protein